jgi:ribosome maturation factor RimP
LEITKRITDVVDPSLNHHGYEVVQVKMVGGKYPVVAIDIDRLDGRSVTMEDCTAANRLISAVLDVENFIEGAYTLEVSSPGESRPLKKISDFERFCGKDVKMELAVVINGKSKFKGKLLQVERNEDDAVIYLEEDGNSAKVKIPYGGIKRASVKRF